MYILYLEIDKDITVDSLNSMIVSLINIENHAALDFLGITNEQRDQIVKDGEDLSDSFSNDSE